MFSIFTRIFSAKARATAILSEYRAAVAADDWATAVRRKEEFTRYRKGVRRHALDTVYEDVLPSHRERYALHGHARLMVIGPELLGDAPAALVAVLPRTTL